MATAFSSINAFNLAETAAVVTINADAWLGSTTNVKTVHTKLRTGDDDDPFRLYYPHELPAIGVQALNADPDEMNTFQEFIQHLRLGFDVWSSGVDFPTADSSIKTIVAYLRRLLRLQTFSPSVNALSSQLDTFLANGDIDVEGADFAHYPGKDGGWLVHGVTFANLSIISGD
uniref:Tail protein n=1 Tax=viral metagenome TaxID=1070528 RepID=A0A6M3LF44_9ZZZZ